jgi:hypothetical protein
MKKIIICCLLLLGLSGFAYCGNLNKIELTDGSVIQGEVVSLNNGVYVIKTATLGEVNIEASKVRNVGVSYGAANLLNASGAAISTSQAPANDAFSSQVSRIQNTMASDPAIMQKVSGLAADPQFQELLKDPAIVNAARSGDVKSLMNNQKLLDIANSPKLQEIKGDIEQKEQSR